MESHQLINQSSGNVELWTPPAIIAVAEVLMGEITLDPACSEEAWRWHGHSKYYYPNHGLKCYWFGNVWMNHPFSKGEKACSKNCKKKTCKERGHCITEDIPGNDQWIGKLIDSHQSTVVQQACCITFASTSEDWFAPLLNYPQFFFTGRTSYIDPETKEPITGAPKGSVFTYLFDDKSSHYDEARMRLQVAMNEAGFVGVAK